MHLSGTRASSGCCGIVNVNFCANIAHSFWLLRGMRCVRAALRESLVPQMTRTIKKKLRGVLRVKQIFKFGK